MEKLIHLLLPRESNNHKAKILHSSSLIVIAALMVILQSVINYLPKIRPDILGYAASISPQEVVNLTNQKRAEAGLSALRYNQTLSSAAYTKGQDMIARDYWAHVAPDGTQPWKFFNDFGYKYRYAGENLARDFSNASSAVDAWMNSPTHRENILNPKYKEIGIGVVEGDLAGSDTTIIVQFFGATYADKVVEPIANKSASTVNENVKKVETIVVPTQDPVGTPTSLPVKIDNALGNSEISTPKPNQEVLISPFTTTRSISFVAVILLLVVFVVDAFLVSRRKITRIAGRTFSHVVFLLMILVIILILRSGKII